MCSVVRRRIKIVPMSASANITRALSGASLERAASSSKSLYHAIPSQSTVPADSLPRRVRLQRPLHLHLLNPISSAADLRDLSCAVATSPTRICGRRPYGFSMVVHPISPSSPYARYDVSPSFKIISHRRLKHSGRISPLLLDRIISRRNEQ